MIERVDIMENPATETLELVLCDHPHRIRRISVNGRELDMAGLTKVEVRIDSSAAVMTLSYNPRLFDNKEGTDMATNHFQPGKVLDWTNDTGEDVVSGELVLIGVLAGVALTDIADGAVGAVQVEEVFELPKTESQAVTAGAVVYKDASTGLVTTTSSENTRIGVAVQAAGASDATVRVKLNV